MLRLIDNRAGGESGAKAGETRLTKPERQTHQSKFENNFDKNKKVTTVLTSERTCFFTRSQPNDRIEQRQDSEVCPDQKK